ncbi:hypothetical protein SAMN05216302_101119 [Nitrosomonas aestuarii]|uniref:Uncharacterized protein n=1 Tax=Nitrosomonas aestuarii TaxID=52441 RepID=A0A1I4B5N7_9PROT|nr:hypothetical protein [Nitrosomonas aestuarii]SFK63477.1 hypothetical protein SAMN05216302_101119 [Nitrosomonas aestuarii]
MLFPVKSAFGEYIGGFYNSLSPTTKGMTEFASRGLSKSIVWAPSRMVDTVQDMLSAWQRNDTDGTPTHPPDLPVMIAAMANDYTSTGRDVTRQITSDDELLVIFPDDVKERAFGVKVAAGDIRAQVAIFSHDEPTAKALAAQFALYIDSISNRRFYAKYEFAGYELEWPVQIEAPDVVAVPSPTESKNMAILAIDITLRASSPLFNAPKEGEPNDGKGTPGSDDDPAGYPVVVQVNSTREDTI